jgi:hypothetical protein
MSSTPVSSPPPPQSRIRRAEVDAGIKQAAQDQLVRRLHGCERRLLDIVDLRTSTRLIAEVCIELEMIREDLMALGTNTAQGNP